MVKNKINHDFSYYTNVVKAKSAYNFIIKYMDRYIDIYL